MPDRKPVGCEHQSSSGSPCRRPQPAAEHTEKELSGYNWELDWTFPLCLIYTGGGCVTVTLLCELSVLEIRNVLCTKSVKNIRFPLCLFSVLISLLKDKALLTEAAFTHSCGTTANYLQIYADCESALMSAQNQQKTDVFL